MKYKAFLTLLFLLSTQAFAFSSNWVLIAETNKQEMYIDKDSIEAESPRFKKAWEKTKYEDGFVDDTTSDVIRISETFDLYDCEAKKISNLKIIDYDDDGNLMHHFDFIGNYYRNHPKQRWDEVVPGSIGEDILNFVCNNVIKKKG